MEESVITAKQHKIANAVEPIVDSAINLGLVWAKYGASVASLALKTQAASFQHLSKLLRNVADALAPEGVKQEDVTQDTKSDIKPS